MNYNEKGFYIIEDKFFDDFNWYNFKYNKKESRPHYFCIRDNKTNLLWIIPLSSKIPKYKNIMEKDIKRIGCCDKIHITKIGKKEEAFLIQDIFPITEEYIKKPYTLYGTPMTLKKETDINAIKKKSKKVITLRKKGISFFKGQSNILRLEQELLVRRESYIALKEVATTIDDTKQTKK